MKMSSKSTIQICLGQNLVDIMASNNLLLFFRYGAYVSQALCEVDMSIHKCYFGAQSVLHISGGYLQTAQTWGNA